MDISFKEGVKKWLSYISFRYISNFSIIVCIFAYYTNEYSIFFILAALVITNLNLVIPNSITSIASGALKNWKLLASITIPDSIKSISDQVFYDCSNLTLITIPSSVTSIGSSAFQNCTSLSSVTIPNSVTSIGVIAFQSCSSLTSVILQRLKTQGLTTLGSNCFYLTGITVTGVLTLYNQGYIRDNLITSGIDPNIVDQSIADPDGVVNITMYYYYTV